MSASPLPRVVAGRRTVLRCRRRQAVWPVYSSVAEASPPLHLSLSFSFSCTRPALASAPTPPTLSFSIVYLPSLVLLSPPSLSLPSRPMRISPRYLRDTRSSRLSFLPCSPLPLPPPESFKTGTPPVEKSLGHEHALLLLFLRLLLSLPFALSFPRLSVLDISLERIKPVSLFFHLFSGKNKKIK